MGKWPLTIRKGWDMLNKEVRGACWGASQRSRVHNLLLSSRFWSCGSCSHLVVTPSLHMPQSITTPLDLSDLQIWQFQLCKVNKLVQTSNIATCETCETFLLKALGVCLKRLAFAKRCTPESSCDEVQRRLLQEQREDMAKVSPKWFVSYQMRRCLTTTCTA